MIEEKNAIITDARISIEDHGLLTAFLHLNYGGGAQGFGGYNLFATSSPKQMIDRSVAGHFITLCLQIAGVDDWSQLKGKTIRVKADWGKVHAIGNIIEDKWFNPSEDYKDLT